MKRLLMIVSMLLVLGGGAAMAQGTVVAKPPPTCNGTNSALQFDGTNWQCPTISGGGNGTGTLTVNSQPSTYSFVSTDNGTVVNSVSATAVTWTLPTGMPVGFNVVVIQGGTGVVAFVGASGVTLNTLANQTHTAGQFAEVGLVVTATNVWNLAGETQ
jgi:hypothetical protein